jgi:hypothetical protein
MHAVVEAKSMFRVVPRTPDQQKGDWLRGVARVFGLTQSQAKKIEYEEVKDLRASRLDAMRATFVEIQERAEKREELLNALTNKLANARSGHGSGDTRRSGEGTSSAGGRCDGAGSGRDGSNRPATPSVPGYRPTEG